MRAHIQRASGTFDQSVRILKHGLFEHPRTCASSTNPHAQTSHKPKWMGDNTAARMLIYHTVLQKNLNTIRGTHFRSSALKKWDPTPSPPGR